MTEFLCRAIFIVGWTAAAACGVSAIEAADVSPAKGVVVPKPMLVEDLPGTFSLARACCIMYQPGSSDAKIKAHLLADTLRRSTGLSLRVREGATPAQEGSLLVTTQGADPTL